MSDEILDYVDENENILGQVKRSEIDKLGLIGRISGVVLFNNAGEMLLSKNSKYKSLKNAGKWHFSAIGHVASGENPEIAAIKEASEEIGAKIDKVEFLEKLDNINRENTGGRRFIYIFKSIYNGSFVLDYDEVEEVKWFKIDEIKNIIKNNEDFFTKDFVRFLKKQKIV